MIKRSIILHLILAIPLLALIRCFNPSDLGIRGLSEQNENAAKLAHIGFPLMGKAFEKLADPVYLRQKAQEITKLYANARYQNSNQERVPLIIIPSLLGTKIHAKLNKTESAHFFCTKKTNDYFLLWLDLVSLIPFKMECFFENLELHYSNNKISAFPGVDTQVQDVGGVSSIDYIDSLKEVGLWNEAIKLLKTYGYQERKDLRAFPYDWRVAPLPRSGKTFSKAKSADSLDVWEQYAKLKELVEETYEINGQKKVAFASLSLGGNYFNLFLTDYVDAEWKAKYVHSFTSFCAPWAGSSEAAEFNLYPPKHYWSKYVPVPKSFKDLARHFPSVSWLWPKKSGYGMMPIIKTPSTTITANVTEISKMWLSLKENNLADLHQKIEQFGEPKPPVGVRHICVYSYNITTLHSLEFPIDNLDDEAYLAKNPPKRIEGDGDSTVPSFSLSVCDKWPGTEVIRIPGVTHGFDMHDPRNLNVLLNVLGLK